MVLFTDFCLYFAPTTREWIIILINNGHMTAYSLVSKAFLSTLCFSPQNLMFFYKWINISLNIPPFINKHFISLNIPLFINKHLISPTGSLKLILQIHLHFCNFIKKLYVKFDHDFKPFTSKHGSWHTTSSITSHTNAHYL